MASYLAQYYEKMKTIGVRFGYQFLVEVPRIAGDGGNAGDNSVGVFSFFATAASLPGRALTATEIPFHAMTFRVPNNVTFTSPWNITVRCDTSNEIRTMIENWANEHAALREGGGGKKRIPQERAYVNLLDETMGQEYFKDPYKTICPTSNFKMGNSANSEGCTRKPFLRTYVLEGVFPTDLSEIVLDTNSTEPVTFTLGLAYQYWWENTESNPSNNPLG